MKIRNILFTLLATAFFFSSCQKDIDKFVPDPGQTNGPDSKWFAVITDTMPVNILHRELLLENRRDSFEVNNNAITITTSTGLSCTFPAHAFVTDNGTAVTGKVYTEMLLVKKKGDMIRMDKPTISNDKMLISGGEVFIKVTQGGHELKLAPGVKIQVRFNDSPLDLNMKLFYAEDTGRFNWQPFDTSYHVSFSTQPESYLFPSNRLHWLNCDYFYTSAAAQLKIVDSLPENYTNANSSSYLVFNTLRSVLPMIGDVNTKRFISTTVTIGLQATVVVISKQGNDYYLGHESLTTGLTNINGEQKVKVTPTKKSLADIETYLSTL